MLQGKEFTISQYVNQLEKEIKWLYKQEKMVVNLAKDAEVRDKLSGRNINRLGNGKY